MMYELRQRASVGELNKTREITRVAVVLTLAELLELIFIERACL